MEYICNELIYLHIVSFRLSFICHFNAFSQVPFNYLGFIGMAYISEHEWNPIHLDSIE